MPIYEYQCNNCNTTFEEWLKVSESEKEQPCPVCHQLASRCVSQTSFVLKGSGWYVTEYGKNSASSHKEKDLNPSTENHTENKVDPNNTQQKKEKETNTTKTDTQQQQTTPKTENPTPQKTQNTKQTTNKNTNTEKTTSNK